MNNNNLLASLTKAASYFVDNMKQRLSDGGYPAEIARNIRIDDAKTEYNNSYIDVIIDMGEGAAPMAAAFEWGSGVHATRGKAGTYSIDPKNSSALSIPRNRWPNYKPPPDIDPVKISHVDHPGIAKKPYIEPSLNESLPEIKKIIVRDLKTSILDGESRIIIIEVKI